MQNLNNDDLFENIKRIKMLICRIDTDVEELYQNGKFLPCIEKNSKQLKVILELLKMECLDI